MIEKKKTKDTKEIISFGLQPRCFDFIENEEDEAELFNFTLSQSINSGLLQLENPIPAKALVPKFNWIKNKEPDDHAYLIVEQVLGYTKNSDATILFLSHFDNKVYGLIKELFGSRAVMLDSKKDLGIPIKKPSQALIQEKINSKKADELSSYLGYFDIIVTCRLLEHASNLNSFISGVTRLIKKDGKIIIEVPDSTKSLLQGDIAMLWEEHTYYFTPESLRLELKLHDFSLEKYIIYNYPQEDALIGIFNKNSNSNMESIKAPSPFGEYTIANIFKKKIEDLKIGMQKELTILKGKFGKIVIFGAGHRAIMFINLLEISNLISFVIDDDPNKNSLKIPLAGIEIKNSKEIIWDDIGICIFAISLNAEKKVKNAMQDNIKKDIKYFSISPDSQYSLPIFSTL